MGVSLLQSVCMFLEEPLRHEALPWSTAPNNSLRSSLLPAPQCDRFDHFCGPGLRQLLLRSLLKFADLSAFPYFFNLDFHKNHYGRQANLAVKRNM